MGKTSRVKGAAYERYLANLFKEIGWEDAKRHLEFQAEEAEMGRDLDGTEPFAVQAKCYKSTPSIMALNQVIPDEDYPIRVAVLKRTLSKGTPGMEVAVVDLPVFMRMIDLIEKLADVATEYSGLPHRHYSDDGYDPWEYVVHGDDNVGNS